MADKVLSVNDLVINFKTDNGYVQAVRDVSFDLYRGETLCIVGESGSGKSVTSKAIMGILSKNAIIENGSIIYRGENLLEVSEDEFYKIRGHKIGMIFQDPLSSLNPIVKIGKQITEATLINSDKLKLMYQDLISEDLIAYKNVLARRDIKIAKLNKELAKCLDSNDLSKEQKKAKKSEIISEIKKIKEEAKQQSIPLKEKSDLTKKNAKIKVENYKKNLILTRNSKLEKLKIKLNKALAEEKLSSDEAAMLDNETKLVAPKEKGTEEKNSFVDSIKGLFHHKKKHSQAVVDILNEIKQVKLDYVNSTRITKSEARRRALEIMREVGIPQPERRFKQYPFEFSGGMRQRIVIAIALTANPEILICDEPTTALDVTIQAQILELINKIKKERDLSCIFITHDLGVVANMADRVAVMYAGKIVEYGTAEEVFFDPRHPYTWALLSSIPDVDSKERLEAIPGTPPNMIYPPKGDAFALRSKYAMKIDFECQPPFFKVTDSHYAATWLLDPRAPKVEPPKIVVERIKNATKEDN